MTSSERRRLPQLDFTFPGLGRAGVGTFRRINRPTLASLVQSAIRNPHSAIQCTGDPEFKAVEKEIKILWLKPNE